MTKEKILAMEPGKELDILVAEKVMNHPVPDFIPEDALDLYLAGSPIHCDSWTCVCRYDEGDVPKWIPDPYSTDPSAAWPVVEKLTEEWTKRNKPISIEVTYDCGAYETKIETWDDDKKNWNEPIFSGSCEAAPEAICKAALIVFVGK
ncbi:unnamed protein product [marine sediment metagenome]|uniref:Phage ABA sandwich domain-containing protein n=1 Tax=marine sediment metagenome TaxID=412755 RepID=X1RF51_9ZZZZ